MVFFVPSYIKMQPQSTSREPSPVVPWVHTELGRQSTEIYPMRRTRAIGVMHLINGEHFSGAERVQQLLGKRLPEQCVDAHFVCLKKGKFPEMSGLPTDHVSVCEMRSRVDLSIVSRMVSKAKELDVDLLHAHTPRTAMIASMISARVRIPWVFHVHSPTARDSTRVWINRVNDLMERWSLYSCSHIITVSKSLRREMLSRGFPRNKVTFIANGVAEQEPIDPFQRINQDNWRLGMVALIRPRKGIEVLLQALRRVIDSTPRVHLDVIGPFENAAYETEVMKLVDALKLRDHITFHGFTRDVPNAMRRLDGMVLPSLFGEGMPMVVLEALALGVPVVATRVEGTPEVIRHGIEGCLAEPRDPESLAAAILQFVSSRSRWTEMSRFAVERHRAKYSDHEMAARTAAVYQQLIP